MRINLAGLARSAAGCWGCLLAGRDGNFNTSAARAGSRLLFVEHPAAETPREAEGEQAGEQHPGVDGALLPV